MKKLLLSVLAAFSMTACQNATDNSNATTPQGAAQESVNTIAVSETMVKDATSVGQSNVNSLNQIDSEIRDIYSKLSETQKLEADALRSELEGYLTKSETMQKGLEMAANPNAEGAPTATVVEDYARSVEIYKKDIEQLKSRLEAIKSGASKGN